MKLKSSLFCFIPRTSYFSYHASESLSQLSRLRDEHYLRLREKSEREDLVMFVNACFAATGQTEYYTDRRTQAVSIDFLHQYVLANYRRVYTRVLAAGVNHFNRATIVRNLLRAGAPADARARAEEGRLIATTLHALPANRVFALFGRLRTDGINNRRTRAVIRGYIASRNRPAFDAVKYRNKVRVAVRHAHTKVDPETGRFLFAMKEQKRFNDPLYDSFLRAHYSKQAVYELPYTVAEGFAERHGIRRDEFLRKIQPQMTHAEKQRAQNAVSRAGKGTIEVDFSHTPLTKLALYVMSLPMSDRVKRADEFHSALRGAAMRVQEKSPTQVGKIAAVMDRSRSAWGSRERRRRPLAVAVATHYLLAAASDQFRSFWTPSTADVPNQFAAGDHAFLFDASGQTDLADPLLNALEWKPDQIIIVSDGYENSPVDASNQIVHAYRTRLSSQHPIDFLHANPVFDPDHFSPKRLGEAIVTIGLRDAEDLGASMGFAKFASGEASQSDLEEYLGGLVARLFESTHGSEDE